MRTITRFDQPASLEAPEMFVLHAERELWTAVLEAKVGDCDMAETPELTFSYGLHPQYHRQVRLVASDSAHPMSESDVIGVATVDLPMADNPRLATVSVAVRRERRGEGIGSDLYAAALEVAGKHGRSTIQVWTWEPLRVPEGARSLPAETGSGSVAADSRESRFLTDRGFVLGQVECISRVFLGNGDELGRRATSAVAGKPPEYQVITLQGPTPRELLADVAVLSATMAADVPVGEMDLEDEVWDAARVQAADAQMEAANRDQLQTLVRHLPSGRLVGFTRIVRDRTSTGVAHQWDTLVVDDHRGHGLGMLMKVVNHAAVGKFWPEVSRLITGNASENSHILAINNALGYEPYAASGFWELRRRGVDG